MMLNVSVQLFLVLTDKLKGNVYNSLNHRLITQLVFKQIFWAFEPERLS